MPFRRTPRPSSYGSCETAASPTVAVRSRKIHGNSSGVRCVRAEGITKQHVGKKRRNNENYESPANSRPHAKVNFLTATGACFRHRSHGASCANEHISTQWQSGPYWSYVHIWDAV